MRYVSVFSGVEAASLAFEPLGWEPICFSEIDPFPSAVLRERYPGVPNLGDITKIDWNKVKEEHGAVDLVVGGSPCQSFSIAGDRTGFDGASGLMWEYVRCVRELMPRWFIWENVPGALSSTHGEDFRCLLESMDDLGYGMAWRVLDAQFFGVAQRRRRVFLVGRLGDVERPCRVLFEREGLQRDFGTSKEKRAQLAARAGASANGSGAVALDGHQAMHGGGNGTGVQTDGSAYTLTANDRHSVAIPINEQIATRCNRLGEGTGFGVGKDGDAAFTLQAAHPHAVAAGFKYHAGSGAGSIGYGHEVAPTCTADYHNPAVLCMSDGQGGATVSADFSSTLTAHNAKDAPVIMVSPTVEATRCG